MIKPGDRVRIIQTYEDPFYDLIWSGIVDKMWDLPETEDYVHEGVCLLKGHKAFTQVRVIRDDGDWFVSDLVKLELI